MPGTILPSTLESVTLGAELADGTIVHGESTLPQGSQPVRRVFAVPPSWRGTIRRSSDAC
ncbi:MAG TPA: 2-phospho-L-lactate transferase CofD family protein [Methylomirabilota bacterium]|nr:2-phospho-L-lactate transferase CofD family protein [Methylomirabilota bacterium]